MKSCDKVRTMVLRGVLSGNLALRSREGRAPRGRRGHDRANPEAREGAPEETLQSARKGASRTSSIRTRPRSKVIESYLPAAMSADEVRAAIKAEVASGANQIGR